MRVEINIPELDDSSIRPGRILERMFRGAGPASYQDNAVSENLVRLTRHAAVEYNLGREGTLTYWEPGGTTLDMGAIYRATTHFETCVTNVHRAIRFLKVISQNEQILPNARGNLPVGLRIYGEVLQTKISRFRNAVQHQEERLLKGKIAEGEIFMTLPTGDEVTVKHRSVLTIDRLELGKEQLKFSDLAQCITDLRACALAIV
jgi:hypothetical protein